MPATRATRATRDLPLDQHLLTVIQGYLARYLAPIVLVPTGTGLMTVKWTKTCKLRVPVNLHRNDDGTHDGLQAQHLASILDQLVKGIHYYCMPSYW